jgi:outer membrane protein assembly factor BamB
MIKHLSITSLVLLLAACGGSKLPEPTPLTTFPSSATIQKTWSTRVNHGNDELLFKLTPAAENDILYAAGNDGTVAAISSISGKKIWSQRYKELPFSSNLALSKHALYLGTDDAQIVKLDKINGAIIWKKSVPSTVIAAPEASESSVFAKTINGEITTLDAATGAAVWNYQQTLPSLILRDSSDPVMQNTMLLVGFSNGALIAFDQISGNTLWNKQVSLPEGKTDVERMADITATPKVVGNTVYAAAYQGKLIAFDLQTQDTAWSADAATYNDFTLSDKAIFVGDMQGNVIAFDRATGTILWKQTALRYRYLTAPTYIGHDLIAIADKEGYLHILSTKDGHFVARVSVDSDGIITAPLYINGLILVQTNKGRLYAYKISPNKTL